MRSVALELLTFAGSSSLSRALSLSTSTDSGPSGLVVISGEGGAAEEVPLAPLADCFWGVRGIVEAGERADEQ